VVDSSSLILENVIFPDFACKFISSDAFFGIIP
jgi:hypothetical protein